MTPLELQSIYQKRRNYTFLLALLLIVIVVISIINPGGIVTTYLPATIFIIIFFLAFIISVLFLYNRDPSDLKPLSIPIDNLFFKSLIALRWSHNRNYWKLYIINGYIFNVHN